MTSQLKTTIKHVGFWAALVLGAAAWTARAMISTVDARYVHTENFTAYQQGQALQHQRDSSSSSNELHDIRAVVFGLDSSDRCRRGYHGYCR